MSKLSDFINKFKKSNKKEVTEEIEQKPTIRIQIDGDINLFKDEKQKIVTGAKQLLEIGQCENMEDAIITYATMFRGLRFKEIKENEDGERIIVLKETAPTISKLLDKDHNQER